MTTGDKEVRSKIEFSAVRGLRLRLSGSSRSGVDTCGRGPCSLRLRRHSRHGPVMGHRLDSRRSAHREGGHAVQVASTDKTLLPEERPDDGSTTSN